MADLRILDCTLRDGGYINEFNFGEREIAEIVGKLTQAGLEIIECGFLRDDANDPGRSLYASAADVRRALTLRKRNCMYVAMLQLGCYSVENLEPWDGSSIDGVRLTFHEHEIEEAIRVGSEVMARGYKLFMQPVGTNTFPDELLLELVRRINQMSPYAFYLVDTLGSMYKNDLLRMLLTVDRHLAEGILLGFHAHNNLQLSFANAQELVELVTRRHLILDSSVFGMGRGAGNLCTELICQYINENVENRYAMLPILEIIDEYVNPIHRRTPWGYSAAYYLSSVNACHPNYATYLLNKQTIAVRDIRAIIQSMDASRRVLFDAAYAEEQYIRYLEHSVDDAAALERLGTLVRGRSVLLLAPGGSLRHEQARIKEYIDKMHPAVFAVNFMPTAFPADAVFISNLRRFRNLKTLRLLSGNAEVFLTSNIEQGEDSHVLNYSSYLNDNPEISDNAGLMLFEALIRLGIKSVALAGFDGYSPNPAENYYADHLTSTAENERLCRMNRAIAEYFHRAQKNVDIQFLTPSIYQCMNVNGTPEVARNGAIIL